jgi:hypothetical protein
MTVSCFLHIITIALTILVQNKKLEVKKKGVYVTLPTNKLIIISVLSIMQFLVYLIGIKMATTTAAIFLF